MENTSSELFKVFLIKYFNISYSSSSVRGWTALISYTAWNSSPYCTLLKNLSCEMKNLFFCQCSDTHATWLKVEYIYYSIYIELKFQNKIYWDFFNSVRWFTPNYLLYYTHSWAQHKNYNTKTCVLFNTHTWKYWKKFIYQLLHVHCTVLIYNYMNFSHICHLS